MVLCLFGQRYTPDADMDELNRLSDALLVDLRESPGFVSYNFYRGEDGEDLGVVRFDSREALEAWRDNLIHRSTWPRAVEFFSEFWIQNCEPYREYLWQDGNRRSVDLVELFRSHSIEKWA
jgi:heme-degrading monooxygenase HmoA